MVVAVVGAGGGTGKACVAQLLRDGYHVRAVVRNPKQHGPALASFLAAHSEALPGERLEVLQGDVTDVESLRRALAGAAGIIFAATAGKGSTPKEIDCQGVGNVADVAREQGGVQRVVLVSSGLVTPGRRFHPIRIMLNSIITRGLFDAKYKGEELLRQSGLPYTIVRPGRLTDDPAGGVQLVAAQGDRLSGYVSRADLAAVCVAAFVNEEAKNVTFELTSASPPKGQEPTPLAKQVKSIFQGLKADS